MGDIIGIKGDQPEIPAIGPSEKFAADVAAIGACIDRLTLRAVRYETALMRVRAKLKNEADVDMAVIDSLTLIDAALKE